MNNSMKCAVTRCQDPLSPAEKRVQNTGYTIIPVKDGVGKELVVSVNPLSSVTGEEISLEGY